MTPAEHYQRGIDLLAEAERLKCSHPSDASTSAAIAHGHFAAAAAGASLQLVEEALRPRPVVGAPDPEPTDG